MTTEQQPSMETRNSLPNGASILRRVLVGENRWIVLCTWPKGKGHEYITWATDETGAAYHGRYFSDFAPADLDFARRVMRGF